MTDSPELLDTRELRILDAVISERSITAASKRLQISQPAISTILRSLRQKLNDPLLIKTGKTMIPTERAELIHTTIRRALLEIESISVSQGTFNPLTSHQTFRIASPDNLSPDFLTHLFGCLHNKAPNVHIEFHSFGPDFDPFMALQYGRFDVVLGNWTDLPENLYNSLLYQDEVVCLMRQDHPLAKRTMTKKDYLAAGHISLAHYAIAKSGVVESYLARHRLKRKVSVTVPFFNIAPYALLETDLIFTVNRSMAEHFAKRLPLVVVPSPLPFPRITYAQLWHKRTDSSPACLWLREKIDRLAKAS